jgi:uncharacterized repeat protein (TIGR03843 family)
VTVAGRPEPQAKGGTLGPAAAAELLTKGDVALKGRIPWSSNATFVVEVTGAANRGLAIYKPGLGERPLWDFDRGLWRREVASYELARHLGWDIVPVTVARPDGPLGEGSLQLFVDAVPDEHYFTLVEKPGLAAQLKRVAAFDVVANNADRKSGHCLLTEDGHVWAIDNGLTFHTETKLRTVIWDFAGEKVADDLLAALGPLSEGEVPAALGDLLDDEEVRAMARRAGALVRRGRFPKPTGDFPYPWPLI